MPLAADTRIGPYRIVAMLGAGGMGEVYRAHDTRLERDVALKVMKPSAAGDAGQRARFEREALAVAALNHPNIVSVFDVGEQAGALYIVTELIEGESLRTRMQRGHMGTRELLSVASQIADGMAAAHQAGIAHRDLKPENVMLTPEARAKILDFGLARQTLVAAAPDQTLTLNTIPGAVMGTVNYMSPEQARGADAQYRSDQFSFGVMLYEMAGGARPFDRKTTPQTLTAILVDEPEPLDAKVPPPLRWTIGRCLAKDPAGRYESTRDLYHELKNQQEHLAELSSASIEIAPAPESARRPGGKWMVAALVAAGIAAGALTMRFVTPKPASMESLRYTPIDISLEHPATPTWSPDGKAFAYSVLVQGTRQVFLRYLNATLSTQLTHGADAAAPVGWSPDGKRIFMAGKNPSDNQPTAALYSLSVTGGEPEFLMPAASIFRAAGARVSSDGRLLMAVLLEPDHTYSLSISSPVGAPWKRYSPAPFEHKQLFGTPTFDLSPDGTKIVYFFNPGGLEEAWLLPFPAGQGTPKKILPDLAQRGSGTPPFSWFPDSRHLVAALGPSSGEVRHLWKVDVETGAREQITAGTLAESRPLVSPDGSRMLFLENTIDYRIVSASLKDATLRTALRSQRPIGMPLWAAKGERFVYDNQAHAADEIWSHESDGSERPLITQSTFPPGRGSGFRNPALSPQGDRLAYSRLGLEGDSKSIWISSIAGGTPVRLTNDTGTESMGAWSPDGRSIVYHRLKEGKSALMLAKTSGQTTPAELSASAGFLPDWSPTGEWISFRTSTGWVLISPDGKSKRPLGVIASSHLTFSRDGRTLYGIRAESDRYYLFSLPVDGGPARTIGEIPAEFSPGSYLNPGVRLSVSPDGQSLMYATYTTNTSLWMLEGFGKP